MIIRKRGILVKKFKVLAIFLILFLAITNSSYASEQEQDIFSNKKETNIIFKYTNEDANATTNEKTDTKAFEIIESSIKVSIENPENTLENSKDSNEENDNVYNIILNRGKVTLEGTVSDSVYQNTVKETSDLADLIITRMIAEKNPFIVGKNAIITVSLENHGNLNALYTLIDICIMILI